MDLASVLSQADPYQTARNQNEVRGLHNVQQMGLLQSMLENAQTAPMRRDLLGAQADLYKQHAAQYGALSDLQRQQLAKQLQMDAMKMEVLRNVFGAGGGVSVPQQQGSAPMTVSNPGMPTGPTIRPAGQQQFPINPMQGFALSVVDPAMGNAAFKGMEETRKANEPPVTRQAGGWYMDPATGAWTQLGSEMPSWDKLIERYQQANTQYRETGVDMRPNMERTMRAMYPKQADDFFGTSGPVGNSPKVYTVPNEQEAIALGRRLEASPEAAARGGPGYQIKVGAESSMTPRGQEDVTKSGLEKTQAQILKGLEENYSRLRDAPQQLQNIEQAKALIPSARKFQGPLGETKLAVQSFFNNNIPGMRMNLGSVMNAEELRTRVFMNIMDNLKKMDAQPSQLQQQIMMESLGNLGKDPDALPRVLDAFGDAIRDKVGVYQQQVEEANSIPGVRWPHKIRLPEKQVRGKRPPLSAFDKD